VRGKSEVNPGYRVAHEEYTRAKVSLLSRFLPPAEQRASRFTRFIREIFRCYASEGIRRQANLTYALADEAFSHVVVDILLHC
jgi:hypothetical protein